MSNEDNSKPKPLIVGDDNPFRDPGELAAAIISSLVLVYAVVYIIHVRTVGKGV